MADIHINNDLYGNEQDELIIQMVTTFREIANRHLIDIEGKFLFEYLNQHNQFDVIEFPKTDKKIFPKFIEIDSEFPDCFIAGLKYYKHI